MRALILVDIQNDFMPGGALAVPHGDEVIAVANRLAALKGSYFDRVVATQDWHPTDHGSFASNNPGTQVGQMARLADLDQIMWPDHCIQNTYGSEFAEALDRGAVDRVLRKGTDPSIDSYSGFFDNGRKKSTGLADYLNGEGITKVVVLGLATDYCVKFTVLDAKNLGFETSFVPDGSRAVNLKPEDEKHAIETMRNAGVNIVPSDEIIRLSQT